MDCGIADYEKAIRENRLGSSPSKLASLYSLEEGEIEKNRGRVRPWWPTWSTLTLRCGGCFASARHKL